MRPRFLPRDWPEYTGWRLPPVTPHRLGEQSRRDSDDPWDRYLFVLARALEGDLGHGEVLVELVLGQLDHLRGSEVEALAGSILAHDHLRRLFPLIGTDRSFSVSLVAGASGWLDFAAAMFPNRFDTELRPLFFSGFVEARDADPELEFAGPRAEYDDRVRARMSALRAEHPGVDHFLHGQPLHPRLLLEELREYAALDDDGLWESSASIAEALQRFDTLTGAGYPQVVFPSEAFGGVILRETLPGGLRRIQMDPTGDLRVDRDALRRALDRFERVDLSSYVPGRRTFHGFAVDGADG